MQEYLESERAANVRRDAVNFFRVEVDGFRQPVAQPVHALAALVDGQRVAVPRYIAAPRLHRRGRQAIIDDVDGDDVIRVSEQRFRFGAIAILEESIGISRCGIVNRNRVT